MDDSRLVYAKCKNLTESRKGSFSNSVKKSLLDLKLGHLWETEAIGDLKSWSSFILTTIRSRDTELWLEAVQEKSKLSLFQSLKSDLVREDFLEWNIPASHRAHYARLRSGTHQLRMETGRWAHETKEQRLCNVCVTGKIESEAHFLLNCYVYNGLREGMFAKIKEQTNYDITLMKDNEDWLMDVLLGHGLKSKDVREKSARQWQDS
jgi:hypothetical protein